MEQIDRLISSAKPIWIALLTCSIYLVISLSQFQHLDFFGAGRNLNLPILSISVPTKTFFFVGSLLLSAILTYINYYLVWIWKELGRAPAKFEESSLSDRISPWLVTDSALYLRNISLRDGSNSTRPTQLTSAIASFFSLWVFGPMVLFVFWWNAAVSRDFLLAIFCLSAFAISFYSSIECIFSLRTSVLGKSPKRIRSQTIAAFAIVILALTFSTYSRTVSPAPWMTQDIPTHVYDRSTYSSGLLDVPMVTYPTHTTNLWQAFWTLSEIDLAGSELVEKPQDWVPLEVQFELMLRNSCENSIDPSCEAAARTNADFIENFRAKQVLMLQQTELPAWNGGLQAKPDFRGANLNGAFLAGLDLSGADLTGADLRGANLFAANLSQSTLDFTMLNTANLTHSNLSEASLRNAALPLADLSYSDFSYVDATGTFLSGANFQGADLQGSRFEAASLWDVNFSHANLISTNFVGARLDGANFEVNQMHFSFFTGVNSFDQRLTTPLYYSWNDGGALRNFTALGFAARIDPEVAGIGSEDSLSDNDTNPLPDQLDATLLELSTVDWRNVFLDRSVVGTEIFTYFTQEVPCQWSDQILGDQEFFARWRGWIEARPFDKHINVWQFVAPEEWQDVTAIPPAPECEWSTEILPSMNSELSTKEYFRNFVFLRLGE